MRKLGAAILLLSAAGVTACGDHGRPATAEAALNVYSWADYIAPDTVANFERDTGIKVRYSTFETNEVLETKLLTGHTNYDIVVPTDFVFERLTKAGVFRKLDQAALPNRINLDPDIMQKLAIHDPGNLYGVPYLWFTTGLGYNIDQVRARLGSAEFDSWSLLFDPHNAAKLQDCGILIIDSPTDVFSSVLIYLGKDPASRDPADLNAAADTLMTIRPFVRAIDSVAGHRRSRERRPVLDPRLVGGRHAGTLPCARGIQRRENTHTFRAARGEDGLIGADMMSIPAGRAAPAQRRDLAELPDAPGSHGRNHQCGEVSERQPRLAEVRPGCDSQRPGDLSRRRNARQTP